MNVVLDYGINNVRSVQKAVESQGHACTVQDHLSRVTRLIIPGVGAFGAAMEHLLPIADQIRELANSGTPILGICLGQQLLFDGSEEHGTFKGLGLIPGWVRYFPSDVGIKVPHMGWSPLKYRANSWLSEGGADGDQVYFVHSLFGVCEDPSDVAATAEYGVEFTAAVQRANVWGTQFHPEKSSAVGMRILRRFLTC